jgi:hypothetical protein
VDEIKHPQQFSSSFFVEFKTHQQNREKRISEKTDGISSSDFSI